MSETIHAIVRPPGDCLVEALSKHPERGSIDPELARRQHAEFRQALASLGVRLIELPVSEEMPDACFTADTALSLKRKTGEPRALLARMGALSRRNEVGEIEAALGGLVAGVEPMEAPATLEGGDILDFGTSLVVGLSARTNAAGVERLAQFAGIPTFSVDVPDDVLHLGTASSPLGQNAVIGIKEILESKPFGDMEKLIIPQEEVVGGNVVVIGNQVIADTGHRVARQLLEDRGFTVNEIDLSEFAKADGGPSCLALFVY